MEVQLTGSLIGRDSPRHHRDLAADVRQLTNILQDLEDIIQEGHLPQTKLAELLEQGREVKSLLVEMEQLLSKYEGLSAQSRLTFDRLAWDKEAAQSLQDRLNRKINALNSIYLTIIASSQFQLQRAMNEIIQGFRTGRRDIDSVSSLATDNDQAANDAAWQLIINDLRLLGISDDVVVQHRDLIVQRIANLISDQTQNDTAEGEEPKTNDSATSHGFPAYSESSGEQQTADRQTETALGESERERAWPLRMGTLHSVFGGSEANMSLPDQCVLPKLQHESVGIAKTTNDLEGSSSTSSIEDTQLPEVDSPITSRYSKDGLSISEQYLAGPSYDLFKGDLVSSWETAPGDDVHVQITRLLGLRLYMLPHRNRTRTLLILLRGINSSLLGSIDKAYEDFFNIFEESVLQYGFLPNVINNVYRSLRVSAAIWLGDISLQLYKLGDAMLAWTWAVLATHSCHDTYFGLNIDYQLRKITKLGKHLKMGAGTRAIRPRSSEMSPIFLKTIYKSFESRYREIAKAIGHAQTFWHSLSKPQVVESDRSIGPLLAESAPNYYYSWRWRYDQFFSFDEVLNTVTNSTSLEDKVPSLDHVESVGPRKFSLLDFRTNQNIAQVLSLIDKISNHTCRIYIGVTFILFLLTSHLKHEVAKGENSFIHSPCSVKAEVYRPDLSSASSQSWGIRFDGTIRTYRALETSNESTNYAESMKSEIVRHLNAAASSLKSQQKKSGPLSFGFTKG